ncbi:hypothetical protein JVU11DRAFT_8744 [Chiua virens]|nr:hypothetical protein JVU11DRAFT_8744 [Chiua virens]
MKTLAPHFLCCRIRSKASAAPPVESIGQHDPEYLAETPAGPLVEAPSPAEPPTESIMITEHLGEHLAKTPAEPPVEPPSAAEPTTETIAERLVERLANTPAEAPGPVSPIAEPIAEHLAGHFARTLADPTAELIAEHHAEYLAAPAGPPVEPPAESAMQIDSIRKQFGRFRILIIDRANAGKTTILKQICSSTEDLMIYDGKGNEVDPGLIQGSRDRGIHNTANELVFRSNPIFFFHDSQGFEAGSIGEFEQMKDFISKCVETTFLKEWIHGIAFQWTNTTRLC